MGITDDYQVMDGAAASHALTLGTLRAAKSLGLGDQLLEFILATDAGVVQELLHSSNVIDPDSGTGQRALRLVRLHRALGDVFGSTERAARFLDSPSAELGCAPREVLCTADGLEQVLAIVERDVRDSLDPRFQGALPPEAAAPAVSGRRVARAGDRRSVA